MDSQKPKISEPPHSIAQPCTARTYSLSKPRLNHILWQRQQIDAYEKLKVPRFDKYTELTPKSKAHLYSKISSKLTFAPTTVVYKNLVPLNVNDLMFCSQHKIQPAKRHTPKPSVKKPELFMFAKTIDPLNLVIKEPKVVYESVPLHFDYFAQYLNLE